MKTCLTLLFGLTLGALPSGVLAATRTWTGSVSSDFYDTNNWAPPGMPAAGDVFNITNFSVVISPAFTFSNQVNWTGGIIGGGLAVAPGALLAVSGPGIMYLSGSLTNEGTVAISGRLQLEDDGVTVANQSQGFVELQGDAGVFNGGYSGQQFVNAGTVRKTSGSGVSPIAGIAFLNLGMIEVQSGTLDLQGGGTLSGALRALGAVTFSRGTFVLAPSAVFGACGFIGVAGGTPSFEGTLGAAMSWTGGTIAGNWAIGASGSLIVNGAGTLAMTGSLTNAGTLELASPLELEGDNLEIVNEPGAWLTLLGNAGIVSGGHSGQQIVNAGTLVKSGGGLSSIGGVAFINGGTIEAWSGALDLQAGGLLSGFCIASNGAAVTFSGGTFLLPPDQGAVFGGGGFIGVAGGAPSFYGTLATAMSWTNGTIGGNWTIGPTGLLSANGAGTRSLTASLTNAGTLQLASALELDEANLQIVNQAGALLELQGDVGIGSGGYAGQEVVNAGTLRKSAGAGASRITGIAFLNRGTIGVLSGQISLTAPLTNSGGTLALRLSSLSDWAQVVSSSSVRLGGSLEVSLTAKFAPRAVQMFPIVSGAPVVGTFNQLILPPGLSVVYSNTATFLLVASSVPWPISSALGGGNLKLSFPTASGQSYTLQSCEDLTGNLWVPCNNFIGNGSVLEVVVPAGSRTPRFFRVRQP